MSRIQRNRAGLVVVLSLIIVTTVANQALAGNTARYTYSGFAANDVALLKKAVDLAVIRFQEERIRTNAYSQARYALVTRYAYTNSHLVGANENSWNLMWRQLYWLSQPNGPGDTGPAFPDIEVRGVYAPPSIGSRGWLGRASYNTVSVYMSGQNVRQAGRFSVQLNTYFFNRSSYYADPNEWAATIAHEMLHNLGHRHDDARVDYESLQIVAFDRAVKYNGRYVRAASKVPEFAEANNPEACGN